MPWDENNVNKLKELWDQGLPTAQIGKLLGFTKNAVVGKAHRIGLERRPSPIRRTAVKPDRKKARSPIMPVLNFENNTSSETTNINKTFHLSNFPLYFMPFKVHEGDDKYQFYHLFVAKGKVLSKHFDILLIFILGSFGF